MSDELLAPPPGVLRHVPRTLRREPDDHPLLPMQESMLVRSAREPDGGLYVQQFVCTLREPIDASALRRAWQHLGARHPVLRTSFHLDAAPEPVQRVHPQAELPWTERDWRGLAADAREAALIAYLAEDRHAGFDIRTAPLARLALFRMEEAEYRLVWTSHHALLDGQGRRILLREVFGEYEALRDGRPYPEPPAAPALAEYVAWARERGEDASRSFWTDALRGFCAPNVLSLEGGGGAGRAVHRFAIRADLTGRLQRLAQREEVTLNTVLQVAWALLLSRYTGDSDVVFGATRVCRRGGFPGAERVVGMLSNTVPVRVVLDESRSVAWHLEAARSFWLAMRPHERTHLARVQTWSDVPAGTALFETLFGFETQTPDEALGREGGAWARRSFTLHQWTTYPLIVIAHGGERIDFQVTYAPDRVDAPAVRRLQKHLTRVLAAFAAGPDRPLGAVDLLDSTERRALVAAAAPPAAEGPVCIHALWEAQAARTPAAVALRHAGAVLTYAALDRRANRLAHLLRARGVGPESRVGVLLERTPDAVAALLAVLKAGGAYVPLDAAHPPDRTAFLLSDAGILLVISQGSLAGRIPADGPARVLCLDAAAGELNDAPESAPTGGADPENLAYVIYTSGSTGRPKGVVVRHRSAGVLLRWLRDAIPEEERALVLGSTSFSFDVSVAEVFGTLCWGGTLVLVEDALELARVQEPVRLGVMVPGAAAELLRAGGLPPSLTALNLAGEALPPDLVRNLLDTGTVRTVRNLYGPTEDTVYSTWTTLRAAVPRVSIGGPVPGTRAYLLDASFRAVPLGVPGELYLAGEGVARGYLGRPGLTAASFVPDPFAGAPGERMYRTRDRGRWLENGEIEYLGRVDAQVKLRGFRIEPGEIEVVLREHPAVADAVVVLHEDPPADRRLVAYVVPTGTPAEDADLAAHLRTALPEYMVPAAVVRLDVLPRTGSGKVDRRGLPAPPTVQGRGDALPATDTERALAGLYAEILGVERVGRRDGFFALGGHSLLAVRLVVRVRERLHADLPLHAPFDAPTVEALAARVDALRAAGGGVAAVPIPRIARDGGAPLPLSFAQERLWFLHRLDPASAAYNVPFYFRLDGALDAESLRRAFERVVERHEALRSVFRDGGGGAEQCVLPPAPFPLPLVDLAGVPDAEDRAAEAARAEARAPFDLAARPPLRARLLRVAPERHLLLATLHHAAADGWAVALLARELEACYAAFASGGEPALPPLPVQCADHAAWQQEVLSDEALAPALDHWRTRLDGAVPPALPGDHPGPRDLPSSGERVPFALPAPLVDAVRAFARRAEATPYMVLLAGFKTLLLRHGAGADLVVGTPVAGRDRPELEGLIGFFANTLALRTTLDGGDGFAAAVARVRETTLAGFAHQHVPFERVIASLDALRGGGAPLVRVVFAFNTTEGGALSLPGLTVRRFPVARGAAKFDLMLTLGDVPGGIAGAWELDLAGLERDAVAGMAERYVRLLGAAIAAPAAPLCDLPLLSDAERAALLQAAAGAVAPVPRGTFQSAFTAQAARTPGAPAVSFRGETLTFRELDRRANRIAHWLRAGGVGPETCVALCLPRGIDAVVGIVAVLKAGGAYVPLDPEHPAERTAAVLARTGVRVALATPATAHRLPSGVRVLRMGEDAAALARHSPEPFDDGTRPENAAYVIHTSGSTGTPKGVVVQHRSLLNLAEALRRTVYRGCTPPRVALNGPLTFDTSVKQIVQLLYGSALHVVPDEVRHDGRMLWEWARREDVRVLDCTPAQLRLVLSHGGVDLDGPTMDVLVAGEEIDAAAWSRLRAPPGVRFHNLYGPTECTVDVTACAVGDFPDAPALGPPLPNVRAYVLDPWLNPVPQGVVGELYVGGEGVARGYLGQPGSTAERFLPDPWGTAGGRMYRTGDRVRQRSDGALVFQGRTDDQVKVRGHRVEPGEVESVLRCISGVRQAVVVAREAAPGDVRLVAYVTGEGAPAPGAGVLRDRAAAVLPAYMVPAAFVRMDELPLSSHGKVDRRALPAPDWAAGAAPYEAPADGDEAAVAANWASVLGVERVGACDDFFALGGHSLLAARSVARLAEALGTEVPLRAIFDAPTVRGFARAVGALRAETTGGEALRPIPRGGGAPLLASPAQRRLWFLQRMRPESGAYNIPYALDLRGPLDADALRRALSRLAARHVTLRTRLVTRGEDPEPTIDPPGAVPLRMDDLRPFPSAARAAEADRRTAAEAAHPFDLAGAPPFRARLLHLRGDHHRLVLVLHHVAGDGWSTGVLFRELGTLYRECSGCGAASLPELPVQYADFAAWQHERLSGGPGERALAYWRSRLAGTPPRLEIPTDRPRAAEEDEAGGACTVPLPPEAEEAVRALAGAEGVTRFVPFLAAWQALLARWSGHDDVVVGAPFGTRPRRELEGLIGFFVDTLPLRAQLADSPTARELLRRVRAAVLEAQAHRDLPLERLLQALRPGRTAGHAPLFQVLFTHDPAAHVVPDFGAVGVERLPVGTGIAKYDLALAVQQGTGGTVATLTYRRALFDATTASRILGHYVRMLAGMAAAPDAPVAAVDLLDAEERGRLLTPATPGPLRGVRSDQCMHHLFAEQAARTPERTALVHGDARVTYGELHRRSDELAAFLAGRGVGPGSRVGLCTVRAPDMVVAMLGILKAGGAYLPLDPAYPAQRLEFMLGDARAPLLLTQERLLSRLPPFAGEVVCLDRDWRYIETHGGAPAAPAVTPEDLFYVTYTSGSTGTPKGTEVPHRAIPGFFQGADYVRYDAEQVLLQHSSPSWDASLMEIWPALVTGGTCVLYPGESSEPELLGEQILRHGVTTVWLTSAYFNLVVDTCPHVLAGARQVMVGGEAVSIVHVRRAMALYPGLRLVNGYGPSECTVFTTAYPIPPAFDAPTVPIGREIGDRRVYLLDGRLHPVPAGIPGELCIGGPCVARGYLGRPALTAEKFIPDPYAAEPGARLYRSGDRARHRQDGVLDFLGRVDHQVKIRGFRVEPSEVEAVLASHPAVREATVVVRTGPTGEARMAAYAAADGADRPTVTALRCWLAERLPAHMVPAALVLLDALPLNAHGKVDRHALPEPPEDAQAASGAAPRTPTQEVLAEAWCAVLGRAHVDVDEDFFDAGGHSLLAVRLVARVREALGVELPLRAVFEAPTVARLAEWTDALRLADAAPGLPPLEPRGSQRPVPASFAQQRLWFLDQMEPGTATYNVPGALRLHGVLDVPALEAALAALVLRHDALRTVFREEHGSPVQVVLDAGGVALEVVDAAAAGDDVLLEMARQEAARPFDLSAGPVFRAKLFRRAPADHLLVITFHHIAGDGWSRAVLHRELDALYRERTGGAAVELAPLPVRYADYAEWQREWVGRTLPEQVAWWRARLANAPTALELPTDRPRPAVRGRGGASVDASVPPLLAGSLRALARRQGATPFMVLLAGWQAVLARWAGQDDVTVGTPMAGRPHPHLEGVVGFFANTLALRTDLSGDPTFEALLARVRETALGAYAHQDLPFERLVEEMAPERDLSRTPLFQVVLALNTASTPPLRLYGLDCAPVRLGTTTAKFDLTLALAEQDGGYAGSLEYATDLYDAPTAGRMLEHLCNLLEAASAAPDRRLSTLPLMGGAERERVLVTLGAPTATFQHEDTLHGWFARQAARTSHRVAVEYADESLTYGALERRANSLARWLRRQGVGPEVPVGLCLERSLDTIVAILGVLKAGGAYVPLDPSYPPDRLAYTVSDSGIRVVLTNAAAAAGLPSGTAARVVVLDDTWTQIARESDAPLAEVVGPASLAYVIYTSGSTGRPKGVQVEHRQVVRLLTATEPWFRFRADDVWTLFHSYAFDFSVWEIWGALLHGARLVAVPWETSRSPEAFHALLRDQRVTVLSQTPSAFRQLVAQDQAAGAQPLSLRLVIFGGEALEPGSLALWTARRGTAQPRLVNMYGITETTVHVTYRPIDADDVARGAASPIGRSIPDMGVYVLDRYGHPVPLGVPGEMYVAGAGVARGYLGRVALTAARFVPDPFSGTPGARLYRSGDCARWLATGELEYLGRLDQQVKVRGFRIEPGEIEAALAVHPGVREAVVVAREDTPGDQRLVAYFAPHGTPPPDAQLREHLGGLLPEYMVPSTFVWLQDIPLTGNGKVDRRALPAPEPSRTPQSARPPRTPEEARLAALWADVLGVDAVGVDEGFFALGGHSLLAVRLVTRIREEMGVRIPLSALFGGGTVERLAKTLSVDGGAGPATPLVRIRDGGTLPPFCCIHAVDGHVLSYASLAAGLGSARRFWGLQAVGVDGGEPLREVAAMADSYVRALRAALPGGPYLLGGWSMGAAVALEAARCLRAAGERVAALVLIDPPTVLNDPGGGMVGRHDRGSGDARMEDILRVREANRAALRGWRPEPYAGRALLLRASERPPAAVGGRPLDWRSLCSGGLEVETVPGDHYSMLEEPHVRITTGRIRAYLDGATD